MAARARPELVRRPVLTGAVYGIGLYLVMNYVVLPLSAAGTSPKFPLWIGLTVLVHMFLIGVPIALFVRRSVAGPASEPPVKLVASPAIPADTARRPSNPPNATGV